MKASITFNIELIVEYCTTEKDRNTLAEKFADFLETGHEDSRVNNLDKHGIPFMFNADIDKSYFTENKFIFNIEIFTDDWQETQQTINFFLITIETKFKTIDRSVYLSQIM